MLYSTWQISYDHVQRQNEASAKLLRLWAYFDNQDVWLELLQHTDQDDPEWIREITEDELSFNAAGRVLCDHGLVEVDQSPFELVESRGYSMHGCVHAWTIHVLNQKWDDRLARLTLKLVGSHVPGSNENKWWATQRRLLQHASRCSNMMLKEMVTGEGMDSIMYNLGYLYAAQGKLDEAEKMYSRALVGKEKAWVPDQTSTIDTVKNKG
jgi:tetratricopeptide (TPR) repeat protein